MATVRGNGTGGARLHALDAVRGGALILGVFFHAALPFLPGQTPLWIVTDASRSSELSLVFFTLHMFRMTLFFFIAGFFARLLLERRGAGDFIKNRLVRIGAPLVAFWPLSLAAFIAVIVWVAIRANGGAPPADAEPPPPLTVATFPLTHLWFLYVLLIFYAAALALRAVMVALDRNGALRERFVDPVVRVVAGPLAPMLLGLPLVAAFWYAPNWMGWFGIPTPDTGLVPNTTALVAYGTAFGFGWLVSRQPQIMQSWRKHCWSALGLGGFCATVCLSIAGDVPVITPAARDLTTLVYASCYALGVWGWTLGIIGAALLFCAGESPTRRYLADASYWIYIVHLPVLLVLQAAFQPYAWPWFFKYPLTLAIAFALMVASYQLFVRYSFIGAILNGKKQKPAKARRGEPHLAAAE
ncbi:acyltransferase family protein [Terricaulis sp.]|uniref:acyltransferase family protein n=1 Tax=Terricaulis sp. TaxID=2768686 RepID=UPI0037838103